MTKNNICSEFINSQFDNAYSLNTTILNTSYSEIAKMYDIVKEVLESKTDWNDFLRLEHAITDDGKIRQDREASYYDRDSKKNISTKVVFKYFVYTWLKGKIEQQKEQLNFVQEMSWNDIMKGNFEQIKKISHLEAFAKGLKKAKERFSERPSPHIDTLLDHARKRYAMLKTIPND